MMPTGMLASMSQGMSTHGAPTLKLAAVLTCSTAGSPSTSSPGIGGSASIAKSAGGTIWWQFWRTRSMTVGLRFGA